MATPLELARKMGQSLLKLNWASKPEEELAELVPDLKLLARQVEEWRGSPEPLSVLVPFLDEMGKWSDRLQTGEIGYLIADFRYSGEDCDDVVEALRKLEGVLSDLGRDPMGYNRSPMETKTGPEHVYLKRGPGERSLRFWLRVLEGGELLRHTYLNESGKSLKEKARRIIEIASPVGEAVETLELAARE